MYSVINHIFGETSPSSNESSLGNRSKESSSSSVGVSFVGFGIGSSTLLQLGSFFINVGLSNE